MPKRETLSFRIGAATSDEFNRLRKDELREDIRLMLEILKRIHFAENKKAAYAAEALRMNGRRGFRAGSLRRKYRAFRQSGGDWRVLIDHSRAPERDAGLNEEFLEFWRGHCQANQRKSKPAYRKLIRMWQAGESIPGYGTWREWFLATTEDLPLPAICPPDLPRGWTYANLMRYAPSKVELAMARHGIAAAKQELPTIIGTRAGLRPLEYIVIDDWRSDFRVHAGIPMPCKLNGVLAMDMACALPLRYGLRPALPQESGAEAGIKRRDTKSIVAAILMRYGYPLDYTCTLVLERGTATISPDDAAAIEEITDGHVRVSYTTMISGTLFGFADRPVGNYMGKACEESYFSLMHNDQADMAGQMGARYALQPAELDARIAHSQALVKAGQFLPPALRRQVRIPFANLDQAQMSHEVMFRWHRNRTEHALEAFEDVLEWREKRLEHWRPAHEMAGMQDYMLDRIETRTRKESPMERFARLGHGVRFEKIHFSCLPRLIEEHRNVTVEKPGEISFQIDKRKRVWRSRDCPALQKPGATFFAHYDRNHLEWIHLTDGQRTYVVSLPEIKAVRRGDAEALQVAIREKQADLNRRLAAVRKRNPERPEKRLEDIEHNLELFENANAVDLVPVPAGQTSVAPVFVQQIDAVGQAQADLRAREARKSERVMATKGNIDDVIYRDEAEEERATQAAYDEAEEDLDALDRIYG